MNRRDFLGASAATVVCAGSSAAAARPANGLKVIIPTTPPAELAELDSAAPGVELIQCRSDEEAFAHAPGAHACYGFISQRLIRAGKALKWVQQPSAGV